MWSSELTTEVVSCQLSSDSCSNDHNEGKGRKHVRNPWEMRKRLICTLSCVCVNVEDICHSVNAEDGDILEEQIWSEA